MTPVQKRNVTLLIGSISAVGDLNIALFVFGVPFIDLFFAIEPWYSPFIATSSLILISLSLPFTGALSDHYGRRPALIAFLFLAAVVTFVCVLAIDYKFLLAVRILQCTIGAAGLVIARAIASDINSTKAGVSQTMGFLVLAFGLTYLLAATLSGWLNNNFGWHSVTMTIGILLSILTLCIALGLQETSRITRKRRYFVNSAFSNYIRLIASGEFLGYTLTLSFTMMAFIPFILLFPTLAVKQFGLSSGELGWINVCAIASLALGVAANYRLVIQMSIPALVRTLSFSIIIYGVAFAFLALVTTLTIAMLVVALLLLCLIVGAAHPAFLAGSVSVDPKRAGTAAGIATGLPLVLGGGTFQLCVSILDGRANSLAIIAGLGAVLTGLSYGLLLRPKKVKQRPHELDFSMGGVKGSNAP